ncbi:hypothetical protein OE88DRAFT_1642647 [Heliocybe sulcata]|uniref:Aminoglycoside phosphotransferase domain-containing protein n=1 Tax=Heliocybe sulcata TaxID=5364 RepID=A0A5C3NK72_9AGAM|nr:hypothetical protein OE88DRAFT_1642647 [Heliocybe sulcata]
MFEILKIKFLVGPMKEQFHNVFNKEASSHEDYNIPLLFERAILHTLEYLRSDGGDSRHEDPYGYKRAWKQCHPVPQMSAWGTFIGYAEAKFVNTLYARVVARETGASVERDAIAVHVFLSDALVALHSNDGGCRSMKELLSSHFQSQWLDAFRVVNPARWDHLAVTTAISAMNTSEAVRLNSHAVKAGPFVVKRCREHPLTEALNMEFVRQNTTIPLPRVLGLHSEENGDTMIVMEFIEGDVLEKLLLQNLVNQDQQEMLAKQLRSFVQQLRSLGTGAAVEAWTTGPLRNHVFYPPPSARMDDLNKLYSYFIRQYEYGEGRGHPFISDKPRDIPEMPTFLLSHGDLNTRNIIVRQSGNSPGGLEIAGIIDWETFGWYPDFWESMATCFEFVIPQSWLDLVRTELGPPPEVAWRFFVIISSIIQISNGIP